MGGQRSSNVVSLIVDDVAEVVMIVTILSLPIVLSYLPPRVIVSQAFVATGMLLHFRLASPDRLTNYQ
jgi:hypothetical protein